MLPASIAFVTPLAFTCRLSLAISRLLLSTFTESALPVRVRPSEGTFVNMRPCVCVHVMASVSSTPSPSPTSSNVVTVNAKPPFTVPSRTSTVARYTSAVKFMSSARVGAPLLFTT